MNECFPRPCSTSISSILVSECIYCENWLAYTFFLGAVHSRLTHLTSRNFLWAYGMCPPYEAMVIPGAK